MAELKDTIYNMSEISRRMSTEQPKKADLHLFSKGLYKVLTIEQVRDIEDVIRKDYKVALDLLRSAKQQLKK